MTAHSTDTPGRDDDAAPAGEGDQAPPRAGDGAGGHRSREGKPTAGVRDDPTRRGRLRRATAFVGRTLRDLLVVTGWTVGLTALFLATAWPRWAFYALLLGGIVGYVWATA